MSKPLIGWHRVLVERFSESELRTFCFLLDVDYDILPGAGKEDKARELLVYLKRRNILHKLLEVGEQFRPDISWNVEYELGPISSYSPWSSGSGSEIAVPPTAAEPDLQSDKIDVRYHNHFYHLGDHFAPSIRLVGAANEFFPPEAVHIVPSNAPYELPSDLLLIRATHYRTLFANR